jgi:hypothetical protein
MSKALSLTDIPVDIIFIIMEFMATWSKGTAIKYLKFLRSTCKYFRSLIDFDFSEKVLTFSLKTNMNYRCLPRSLLHNQAPPNHTHIDAEKLFLNHKFFKTENVKKKLQETTKVTLEISEPNFKRVVVSLITEALHDTKVLFQNGEMPKKRKRTDQSVVNQSLVTTTADVLKLNYIIQDPYSTNQGVNEKGIFTREITLTNLPIRIVQRNGKFMVVPKVVDVLLHNDLKTIKIDRYKSQDIFECLLFKNHMIQFSL